MQDISIYTLLMIIRLDDLKAIARVACYIN